MAADNSETVSSSSTAHSKKAKTRKVKTIGPEIEDLTWVEKKRSNQALQALYLFFAMSNKFNNTGARKLDFMYLMTLKLLKNHIFGVKMHIFAIFYATNRCH